MRTPPIQWLVVGGQPMNKSGYYSARRSMIPNHRSQREMECLVALGGTQTKNFDSGRSGLHHSGFSEMVADSSEEDLDTCSSASH